MQPGKKLGIIGGMGSRAGAALLQKIIDYSPAETDQEFPEIIFHNNAIIPDRTRSIVYHEPSPLPAILKSVDLFNQNQVEIMALACITSYYFYDQIVLHTSAEVVNPLHLAAAYLNKEYDGTGRIGLLATTGSIKTGLFHKELQGYGAEIITLSPESQETLFMRAVYMKNGFKSAIISPEARDLMDLCVRTLVKTGVDLIIGGCTEVSIALDPADMPVPYLDSLDLMAQKLVGLCYDISPVVIPA